MIKPSPFNFKRWSAVACLGACVLAAPADSLVKPNAKSLFSDKKGAAVGDSVKAEKFLYR